MPASDTRVARRSLVLALEERGTVLGPYAYHDFAEGFARRDRSGPLPFRGPDGMGRGTSGEIHVRRVARDGSMRTPLMVLPHDEQRELVQISETHRLMTCAIEVAPSPNVTTVAVPSPSSWQAIINPTVIGRPAPTRPVVTVKPIAELDRRQKRARAERDDVVRALVAGERVDNARAERVLSHPLTGRQVGFVCWNDDRGVDLDRFARHVGRCLGASHSLVVADGPLVVWGWTPVTGDVRTLLMNTATDLPGEYEIVHVAVAGLIGGPRVFEAPTSKPSVPAGSLNCQGAWQSRRGDADDLCWKGKELHPRRHAD